MNKTVVANEDYAQWLLNDAEIRASARRQLKFGLPVLVATMLAAAFAFGNPSISRPVQPASHHMPKIMPVYPSSMVG